MNNTRAIESFFDNLGAAEEAREEAMRDSRFTKQYPWPSCRCCGEEFRPVLEIQESQNWTCLRCDHRFVVKRIARAEYGTAEFEEIG